jgi:hypothetical protein
VRLLPIGIWQRNSEQRLIRAGRQVQDGACARFINANLGADVEIILIDESTIYPWALDAMLKSKHKMINHAREYAHSHVDTKTVESAFAEAPSKIGTQCIVPCEHRKPYEG